jgi:redox-sensitive bicupin YhaK (pirin superfamily)
LPLYAVHEGGSLENERTIRKVIKSRPTIEGAGVHLKRVFGNGEVPLFDPFLMLDDFRSNNPDDYRAGFPWHPHRGIETITYVLSGDVEHGDSMGNKGVISSGDTQWMTAGSGIIHQEMPLGDNRGRMEGFQLWANLPRSDKMMEPRYRDIKSGQIPLVTLGNGVSIKVIAGKIGEHDGPVKGIITDPEYLDVTVPGKSVFTHSTRQGYTVFTYVIEGEGVFDEQEERLIGNGSVCLYEDGDRITVTTGSEAVRFLLISGKPIREPVAWYGPIVMNTDEELEQAFEEYQNGTFIQKTARG